MEAITQPNTEKPPLKCATCNKGFKTVRTFGRHNSQSPCTRKGKAKCCLCGVYYVKRGLRLHEVSCWKKPRTPAPPSSATNCESPIQNHDVPNSVTLDTIPAQPFAAKGDLEARFKAVEEKLQHQITLEEGRQMESQIMADEINNLSATVEVLAKDMAEVGERLLILRSKINGQDGWLRSALTAIENMQNQTPR